MSDNYSRLYCKGPNTDSNILCRKQCMFKPILKTVYLLTFGFVL